MKILMRSRKNDKWQLVNSAAYANESELQKLLFEQPSLISVEEVREGAGTLVAAVREFPLDIGSIDLVGFTAGGDIAVVECKLAANAEVKRKVIGQVLEYGACLWGMRYEALDQKILQRSGQNLAEFVRDSAQDPDWEEESFRASVEQALQDGNFILIVVVDEINEDLSRIVRFINDAGKPAFSLAALEMRRFQKEQTEILVPHLFGTGGVGKGKVDIGRMRWTEERFFDVASAALPSKTVKVLRDLYEWSLKKAKRVWFGNGRLTGSFTFHYEEKGKHVSMFSAYTTGELTINYGWLSQIINENAIQELHENIITIHGFRQIPSDFAKWPTVKIEDVFVDRPDDLARFKEAVEAFGKNFQ